MAAARTAAALFDETGRLVRQVEQANAAVMAEEKRLAQEAAAAAAKAVADGTEEDKEEHDIRELTAAAAAAAAAEAADATTNDDTGRGGDADAAQPSRLNSAPLERRDLSALLNDEQKAARKWDTVITADLGRTYPDHCMFHRGAFGQDLLQQVLRAYGVEHRDFGYTQGMNFIAAMFLSYMPARDAYWTLTAVMDQPRWNLRDIFSDRTPLVPQLWFVHEELLRKYCPKVQAHFAAQNMMPSMYVTKWFVTLFTRDFHFDFVVRVWDIFLHQGWKIIHRVALAILKSREKALLALDMEGIMYYIRDMPATLDAQATLDAAHKIPLRTAELTALEAKWSARNK